MKHPHPNKSRKILAFVLVLSLLATLTGCFKKETPDSTGDTQAPPASTAAPTQTTVPSAPPVTTEPPVETTVPPTTEAPETEPPVEPTTAPTEPPETEPPTEPEKEEPVIGIVYTTRLNIRENPGTAYGVVGAYYSGEKVEILETKDGWGRTDKGWISMEYINIEKKPSTQDSSVGDDKEAIVGNGASEILGYGVATLESLNVRSGPGTGYKKIDTIKGGTRHAYFQKEAGWVRIDAGWVSTGYFYVEGTTGEGAGIGYIHTENPNIRSGPGLEYDVVGKYQNGDTVKILCQIGKWGCTDKGWVSMSYVAMKQHDTGMGVVTAETLNIRKQAMVDSTLVGTYAKGDQIEILEVYGDWGKTDKGWVSLDYVDMTGGPAGRSVPTPASTGNATVIANGLNIRKEPSISAESVGGYGPGDQVEILEVRNGWGRTDRGWIWLEYVRMDTP